MVFVVKRGIIYLGIGLIIILITLSLSHRSAPAASFNHQNIKCVIIDPGHGVPDGGAVSKSGTAESLLNLQISLKLRDELEERGFTVIMTRDNENGLDKKKKTDMHKRLNIMSTSSADMFVSIHINKFHQSEYRGAEVLYSPNFVQSTLLAQLIMDEIKAVDPANQRRQIKKAESSLFLMKNATLPSVIVECGFLSNPDEEALLKSDDYQKRIAAAVCDGISAYYKNVGNGEQINTIKSEA